MPVAIRTHKTETIHNDAIYSAVDSFSIIADPGDYLYSQPKPSKAMTIQLPPSIYKYISTGNIWSSPVRIRCCLNFIKALQILTYSPSPKKEDVFFLFFWYPSSVLPATVGDQGNLNFTSGKGLRLHLGRPHFLCSLRHMHDLQSLIMLFCLVSLQKLHCAESSRQRGKYLPEVFHGYSWNQPIWDAKVGQYLYKTVMYFPHRNFKNIRLDLDFISFWSVIAPTHSRNN